jgi:hypothetical protein
MRDQLRDALIARMTALDVLPDPDAVGAWTEQLDFKQASPKLWPDDPDAWDMIGSVVGFMVAEIAFDLFGNEQIRTLIVADLLQKPLVIRPEMWTEGAIAWTARCTLKAEMDADAGGVLVTQLRFEIQAGLFVGISKVESQSPMQVFAGDAEAVEEDDFTKIGEVEHG